MQQIIKQADPSRQLFETVNFAFMKIFDFLVKITIFWAFLLFFGRFASCIMAAIEHLIGAKRVTRISPKKGEMP